MAERLGFMKADLDLLTPSPEVPPLTVGSLFAGIGGFDLGFEQAGFQTLWQVEQERFCRSILQTHFPNAARFTDVRDCGISNLSRVDVITAGVPCQDVSVAGKRAGLAGERTGLFYEFARILKELRPAWFVFENVPGLLSSNRGRDFAEILRVLMVECGYGVSWRVLNSQFFGVAQRRRRVFVVGRFGRPCPAEILFEREGRGRDSKAGRTERTGTASEIAHSITQSCFKRHDEDTDTLVECVGGYLPVAFNIIGSAQEGRNHAYETERTGTIQHKGNSASGNEAGTLAVAFSSRIGTQRSDPGAPKHASDERQLIGAATDPDRVRDAAGLPEGMDSARYRALGNAVTVSVARWIALRLKPYCVPSKNHEHQH